jgi:hypothetical protein
MPAGSLPVIGHCGQLDRLVDTDIGHKQPAAVQSGCDAGESGEKIMWR